MKYYGFIFLLFLSGCGTIPEGSLQDLTVFQPQVLSVTPVPQSRQGVVSEVVVVFSQPIDPSSVTPDSLRVSDAAEKKGVRGQYRFEDQNKKVIFIPEEALPKGECLLRVTTKVMSEEFFPLNQTPGEGPSDFVSRFFIGEEDENNSGNSNVGVSEAGRQRPTVLVLNEVFYDADGKDTEGDLFIELKGSPEADLSRYQILFLRGDDGEVLSNLVIPDGMRIPSDGLFVIADAVTGAPEQTHVLNADWVKNFDPPNGPDCLQLLDEKGNLLDALGYGTPLALLGENNLVCYETITAPDVASGESLSRLPDHQDSDNNLEDWEILEEPTPGEE